jgi:hypothetical protein
LVERTVSQVAKRKSGARQVAAVLYGDAMGCRWVVGEVSVTGRQFS